MCLHGSSDKVITCSEGKPKSTNGGGLRISSFVPRLPPLKTGKIWEHSSCEWTQGGRRGGGPNTQIAHTKLESKFSFDHTKLLSPMLDYSARMGDLVRCFHSWAPPPMSTSHPSS